ncbi:testis-expressed protein 9 isoform X2 [Narcine bancroftii]|uniref:testis-expressed protein 9 isoform X2 n=1 Tax=Narcine bancroftii TaxID=1343680 RepID=UPI003832225B
MRGAGAGSPPRHLPAFPPLPTALSAPNCGPCTPASPFELRRPAGSLAMFAPHVAMGTRRRGRDGGSAAAGGIVCSHHLRLLKLKHNENFSLELLTPYLFKAIAKKTLSIRSGSLPSPSAKKTPPDLLAKEEEFKKLNAELEAKTAELVRQAEEVMKGQEEMLSQSTPQYETTAPIDKEKLRELFSSDESPFESEVSKNKNKAELRNMGQSRPCSANKGKKITSAKHKTIELHMADDVGVPEDFSNFSLEKTISKIEGQMKEGAPVNVKDEIMPNIGNEMSTEAQIRFLKAKLRVMQEELDRLVHEYNKKDDENSTLTNRVKEVEEERNRLQKTTSIQLSQIEKYKSLVNEAQRKSENLHQQVSFLQKELDSQKRAQKQFATNHNATEVRLNRALEEIEKYKAEVNKLKQSNKDITNKEKLTIEQLKTENKKLETQKAELITGFKKQMKLIDILKRQKMHMEAAKMLSFTEEEFIKALDWGN